MIDFAIATKQGFKLVTGHKINKDFSCYKLPDGQWIITDTKSGLYVEKGFKKGMDCFEWVKNTDMSEIQKKRSKPKYAEACKKLQEWMDKNL